MGILSYFREKKQREIRAQERTRYLRLVDKAADMAISSVVRDMTPGFASYVYVADVQNAGWDHFHLKIEEAEARDALRYRLAYRGYNPDHFAPRWDYDNRTPKPHEPQPCDGYDYVGENEWCRRCGWYLADHPEYSELTEGKK